MNRPENFKFDVRVRERLMAQGALQSGDLAGHLSALTDLEGSFDIVELEQPALASEKLPPPPVAPLPGLAVPMLNPLQSAAPVRPIEGGVGLGVGGRVSPFEPSPKVSPFEGMSRVSPFEPAPKVNPFEPAEGAAPAVRSYEPAPRIPSFERPQRVSPFEPAPKVSPFEPAPKVSPFEPASGSGPGLSPYEPAPPLPGAGRPAPVQPAYGSPQHGVPVTSPLPAYRQPTAPVAEPVRAPNPAFPTSPFGAGSAPFPNAGPVSPMQPSPLVSPFEPVGAPAPRPEPQVGPDGLPRNPGNDPNRR
jgi:hypothetical protein